MMLSLLLLLLLLLSFAAVAVRSYDLYQLIPQPPELESKPKLVKYSPYTADLSVVFHASRAIDVEYLYLYINYIHSYIKKQKPTYVICLTGETQDPGMYIPNGRTILITNQHTRPVIGLDQYSNLYHQRCTSCSLGLIHLNHELTPLPRDSYNSTALVETYNTKFSYVFRNYYSPDLCRNLTSPTSSNSTATCIPLGPCNIGFHR
ncbi:hypothetical protein TrST_g3241 [Triparma strigata]|uniref:Uncharacterized protein n=1 Tax=Triparma strigata TaxID=1606541 RepID=A0A9W7B1B2_9STRA|nr:hypothetical protein TrST_g3241 [Triparma strigata]